MSFTAAPPRLSLTARIAAKSSVQTAGGVGLSAAVLREISLTLARGASV